MKSVFVGLAFFLLSISLTASTKYNTISNADGLSNNSVTCIYQDSSSLLWIGTWDGLNVFNGHEIKTYKFEHNKENTISNNIIRSIAEQSHGIVWVGTDYGVNRIDTDNKTIDCYYLGYEHISPPREETFSIAISSGTVFCSAIGWGVAYFNETYKRMQAFNVPNFPTSSIVKLLPAQEEDAILVKTADNGYYIWKYTFDSDNSIVIHSEPIPLPESGRQEVFCVKGQPYISAPSGNVYAYYDNAPQFICRLPEKGLVKALSCLKDGRLVMACESGKVYTYSPSGRKVEVRDDLSNLNILSLFPGTQDILWIGSDGGGLIQVYDYNDRFNKVSNRELFHTKYSPVRSFFKDPHENLYVGTKGNGICIINSNGHSSLLNTANGLSNDFVYALSQGLSPDEIIIGHDGQGFDIYNTTHKRVINLAPIGKQGYGSIYSVLTDCDQGIIWLGTSGYGLIKIKMNDAHEIEEQSVYSNNKLDPESIGNNTIFAIQQAADGKLWLGTRGAGLNLFDPQTAKAQTFTTSNKAGSISSNDILCLHTGRDGTLWIGTSYGLNRLIQSDHNRYSFEWFIEEDGLSNNTIHGIIEDDQGNIWLSTNKGLSKFNLSNKQFINYYNDVNLQNNEFSDGASYRDNQGYLYFGGVDGFNWFAPAQVHDRSYEPKPIITDFFIKQQRVDIFNRNERIRLKSNDNFFSIQFSALDFIDNANCEYSYILKGFNDGWIYNSTSNTAVFTNVPSGEYEFIVRATNGDKVWSSQTSSLLITIETPWWLSLWAKLAYIFILCGTLYISQLVARNRLKQKREKDTYEAKLSFFTNIAHEFCTPLTLIYGSTEQLLLKYSLTPTITKYINVININVKRMQRLIWELLEFRRIEEAGIKVLYSEFDIKELFSTILDSFSERKEQLHITQTVDLPKEERLVISDHGAMEKILYNLISNAYKYTPTGGTINVLLEVQNNAISFTVSNSGKGIKQENLSQIFNRFEILDNFENQARKGNVMRNGIGLALAQSLVKMLGGSISVDSEVNKLTTFSVTIPLASKEQLSPIPIAEEPISMFYDDSSIFNQPKNERHNNATGQSILIVDDEDQIRSLVEDILSPEYKIIQARDGLDAMDKLTQEKVDLIISDVCMPNLDGLGLLKKLKDNEITKHIPLIFLTFKIDIENEVSGYEMGGEAYIPKPFHPKQLTAVVHQVLGNRTFLKKYFSSSLSSSEILDGQLVTAEDKSFIVEVTKLIEENITHESLSADFLANKLLISRMQLYRKLKRIADTTPGEYIRVIRIKRAAHLLKTSKSTVQEIMYQSGFNNKSYFYREFAKAYGFTPNKYRNS